jgi:hypothetical protein
MVGMCSLPDVILEVNLVRQSAPKAHRCHIRLRMARLMMPLGAIRVERHSPV